MSESTYQADVVIAGAGLAGLVAAYELMDQGKSVVLIDKDTPEAVGGLAKKSFGGVMMVGTPHQKRMKIDDTPDLAWRDWQSFADWDDTGDELPKEWARFYCDNSYEYIYEFLDSKKIEFLPVVNWPERGLDEPGNSVPRWHIAWGTGYEIADRVWQALQAHPKAANLTVVFEHEVNDVTIEGGRATGLAGKRMDNDSAWSARGDHVIIATGGICGGDLSYLKENWYEPWGKPPEILLNGAHKFGDGLMHRKVQELGGNLTHLDKQWHYAAGVHHPDKSRPADGLSLVPPRSALWMDAHGKRIGPRPMLAYADTRGLVETILQQPGQYTWQVLNMKIAAKELAVSGCNFMEAFRFKKKLLLVKHVLFGNTDLVNRLIKECPDDFVVANSLDGLVEGMNERSLPGHTVDLNQMRKDIDYYDRMIDRGPAYFNDEQLRRIANFRTYRGDRIRTCKFQKILDPGAMPLIAIREFVLARKSLGGIQTNMNCEVLKPDGSTIPGLYAIGETAGFGGGGIHGKGSLEGTFLGSCVLTGRVAGKYIGRAG